MDWRITKNKAIYNKLKEGGDYLDGYMLLEGIDHQTAVARFTSTTVIIAYNINIDGTFITETIEYKICKK